MSEMNGIFMLCTMALFVCSVLLSFVFLILSCSEKYEKECKKLFRYAFVSAVISLLSPLVTFLFGSFDTAYDNTEMMHVFYSLSAVLSAALFAVGVIVYVVSSLVRKNTAAKRKQRRRFCVFEFCILLLSIVLSWVFSLNWMA